MSVFDEYITTSQGRVFADKYTSRKPQEDVDCIFCSSPHKKEWYRMGGFISFLCRDCKTRFVSPRYNAIQMKEHYSKELFTQSSDYEGVRHNMLDEKERQRKRCDMKEEIDATLAHCPPGARVLDVGCQTGIYLEALPKTCCKFGVEISEWAAEHTRTITNADIRTGRVEEVDYPGEYFDVINMSYVLEHLYDPLSAMKKICGWIKHGGILIISVPNFNSFCARIFREFYRLADPRQHVYLPTPGSLKRMLSECSMAVKKIYYPYFGTPYCSLKEQKRLVGNAVRRFFLPLLLRCGKIPEASQVISPPFYGNIMTVVSKKA